MRRTPRDVGAFKVTCQGRRLYRKVDAVNLTNDGVAIDRAQLEVESDKEAFLLYVRKGEEARAARALNQKKILNVSVVEQPTLPLVPTFPKLGPNLVMGSVLALALALAAAY
jgi:uncharacterized protein involved in exopolysaccharide biosynthesis